MAWCLAAQVGVAPPLAMRHWPAVASALDVT